MTGCIGIAYAIMMIVFRASQLLRSRAESWFQVTITFIAVSVITTEATCHEMAHPVQEGQS